MGIVVFLLLEVLCSGDRLLVAQKLQSLRLGWRHLLLSLLFKLQHLLLSQLALRKLLLSGLLLRTLDNRKLLWTVNVRASSHSMEVTSAYGHVFHAFNGKRWSSLAKRRNLHF